MKILFALLLAITIVGGNGRSVHAGTTDAAEKLLKTAGKKIERTGHKTQKKLNRAGEKTTRKIKKKSSQKIRRADRSAEKALKKTSKKVDD